MFSFSRFPAHADSEHRLIHFDPAAAERGPDPRDGPEAVPADEEKLQQKPDSYEEPKTYDDAIAQEKAAREQMESDLVEKTKKAEEDAKKMNLKESEIAKMLDEPLNKAPEMARQAGKEVAKKAKIQRPVEAEKKEDGIELKAGVTEGEAAEGASQKLNPINYGTGNSVGDVAKRLDREAADKAGILKPKEAEQQKEQKEKNDVLDTKVQELNAKFETLQTRFKEMPNVADDPLPSMIIHSRFERAGDRIVLKANGNVTKAIERIATGIGYTAVDTDKDGKNDQWLRDADNKSFEIDKAGTTTFDLSELIAGCDGLSMEKQADLVRDVLDELLVAFSQDVDSKNVDDHFQKAKENGSVRMDLQREDPKEYREWVKQERKTADWRSFAQTLPEEMRTKGKSVIGTFMEGARIVTDKAGKQMIAVDTENEHVLKHIAMISSAQFDYVEHWSGDQKKEVGIVASDEDIREWQEGISLRFGQEAVPSRPKGSVLTPGQGIEKPKEEGKPGEKMEEVKDIASLPEGDGKWHTIKEGGQKGFAYSRLHDGKVYRKNPAGIVDVRKGEEWVSASKEAAIKTEHKQTADVYNAVLADGKMNAWVDHTWNGSGDYQFMISSTDSKMYSRKKDNPKNMHMYVDGSGRFEEGWTAATV